MKFFNTFAPIYGGLKKHCIFRSAKAKLEIAITHPPYFTVPILRTSLCFSASKQQKGQLTIKKKVEGKELHLHPHGPPSVPLHLERCIPITRTHVLRSKYAQMGV